MKILEVEKQLDWIKKQTEDEKTISLDVYFRGDYNLDISRNFDDGIQKSENFNFISRNELSMEEQLEKIPKGSYILVDDIASGSTIKKIKIELKKRGIFIKKTIALSDYMGVGKFFDILDARDFFIDTKHSGLYVNGVRTPYWAPFVNLFSRANIYRQFEFTEEIIKLNIKIISDKKVKEILNPEIFLRMGYNENENLKVVLNKILKKMPIIAEIGHFYAGDEYNNQAFTSFKKHKQYKKVVLIDNYHSHGNLDVSKYYDYVFFEKDMVPFVEKFIERIPPYYLKWEYFKNKKVLFYKNKNIKISLFLLIIS